MRNELVIMEAREMQWRWQVSAFIIEHGEVDDVMMFSGCLHQGPTIIYQYSAVSTAAAAAEKQHPTLETMQSFPHHFIKLHKIS